MWSDLSQLRTPEKCTELGVSRPQAEESHTAVVLYDVFEWSYNPGQRVKMWSWQTSLCNSTQLSNEKIPGYLLYIGDYTTQLYGD